MKEHKVGTDYNGWIIFVCNSSGSLAGLGCPYYDIIMGFDSHKKECPSHKLVVTRCTGEEDAENQKV